jgi:hypothetical protein
MTDLAPNVHLVLRGVGFETWPAGIGDGATIAFEDEAIMGFIRVFESARALLDQWHATEEALLGRYAGHLRVAGEKAWNVYTVLLTPETTTNDLRREIRWIEENLDRTRKIAAAGVTTRDDVVAALLPLLPITAKPMMDVEPAADRLARRIKLIAPELGDDALDDRIAPGEIARRLGGRL